MNMAVEACVSQLVGTQSPTMSPYHLDPEAATAMGSIHQTPEVIAVTLRISRAPVNAPSSRSRECGHLESHQVFLGDSSLPLFGLLSNNKSSTHTFITTAIILKHNT